MCVKVGEDMYGREVERRGGGREGLEGDVVVKGGGAGCVLERREHHYCSDPLIHGTNLYQTHCTH